MPEEIRTLQETPTWAVATICFLLVLLSMILERSLHLITHWLRKHKMKSVEEAVEKLKSELMQLGFISLILAALQGPISNIYVPIKYANSMLPCHVDKLRETENHLKPNPPCEDGTFDNHKFLEGMVPLVSKEGIHQLHIFIFLLASTQLVFSLLIMVLGRAKMSSWKAWEEETQSISYQVAYDPQRFRLTRDTTFVRRHLGKTSNKLLWVKCFFRQFFHSVEKVDYFTLRHGFIKAHMPTNNNFNFQNYIQRSLEDDFKVVVGISPSLWLVVITLLLADLNGLRLYVWIAYFPLIILLVLGTKLEVILARMALQLEGLTDVTRGAPEVQPNDNLFWFSKPRFVLSILHFIMVMNAFELAFFLWAMWQFRLKTCYHQNIWGTLARMLSAMIVQIICSYITLPIYALVSQMGSQYKSSAAMGEQIIDSILQWYARVKKKKKQQSSSHQPLLSSLDSKTGSSRTTTSMENSSSPIAQPTVTLAETILSPEDVTNEVEEELGEPNLPAGEAVLELSVLESKGKH